MKERKQQKLQKREGFLRAIEKNKDYIKENGKTQEDKKPEEG